MSRRARAAAHRIRPPDQHPWCQAARADRGSRYRDYGPVRDLGHEVALDGYGYRWPRLGAGLTAAW